MRPLALLAAGLATLVLAACGDDDQEPARPTATSASTATTAARGYAQTGAAVDAICSATNAPGSALLQGLNGKPAHDAPLLERAAEIYRGGLERMKVIEPDPKLRDAFDQFIALAQDQVTLLEHLRDAAQSGDRADYKAATTQVLEESDTTLPARQAAAKALGAKACAKR
jgi:hypothetical protein